MATASPSATIDNDGDPDLFIARWRSYALYRNRGDGTFEDATESAGLGGDRDWPTSAAFADLDGDGDLDLYVCHYLVWDEASPFICHDPKFGANRLCNPGLFPSRPTALYRNDGGRFVEVTKEAGIVDTHGRGMGVLAADLDDDGRIDLYVANDQSANFLWRNLGGFRFEEVGHAAGVAASGSGGYQAGMGVGCGDVDGDGRPDLVVTNFYDEGTTLYQNLGQGHLQRPVRRLRPARRHPRPPRLRDRLPRRQQRRPARPGPGQRPRRRLPARVPLRDAAPVVPRGDRRPADGRRRLAPALRSRPSGSAGHSPSATSTTTAAPTSSWPASTPR